MKHAQLSHPFAVDHQATMAEMAPDMLRFVNMWSPSRVQPWATLTILHGLGDHGGRFNNVAFSLASAGIGVIAVDLPGHGRSPGRRGIIDSYDRWMDEVGNAANFSSKMWTDAPSFVFGHSMGGNLALNWAIRRRFESHPIAGVIAVAPMLKLAIAPKPFYLKGGRWLEKRFPHWRLNAPVDVRQLCSDPIGQDAYRRDPFVHRKMSLRLGMALVDSGQWVLDHADQLEKPCLLMHGCDDTLTCPHATEAMADRMGSNASLKLWPHARHDLHFELQRESVYNYLMNWMRKQSSTKEIKHRTTLRQAA